MGFRTLNQRLFDWAHGSDRPQGVSFDLDERGRKQIFLRAYLRDVPLKPGEHPVSLGVGDRYFKMTCILDDSALNLQSGIGVAGASGRVVGAAITFRIEPTRPVTNLSLKANVFAHTSLGGSASVASSTDGETWSEPEKSDPKNQNHVLVAQRGTGYETASRFSKEPMWVRVQFAANSGTETNTAASLDSIEITAAVAPPLN